MEDVQGNASGYSPPAIHKATRILRLISEKNKALGISDLARLTGYSKGTVFGLTRALREEGLLRQEARGKKFALGSTLFELAISDWNYIKVNLDVQPFLDELRDQIQETTCLGVINRNRVLIMATAEATKALKITVSAGSLIPLLPSAIGKVILSGYEEGTVKQLIEDIGLTHHTDNSITDPDEYLASVAHSREIGYAVDDEEYLQGVRAVAVSVNNLKGLPMAIWAVGFCGSMDTGHIPSIARELTRVSGQINTQINRWL